MSCKDSISIVLNIGDLQHAEEIQQEIIRCQNEISKEVLEKVLRSRNSPKP